MSHLSKEEAKEALRQSVVTQPSPDEPDAMADWPLHKIVMAVYKEYGPDAVAVLLEPPGSYEVLVDNAKELERRHFPQVAKLLRDAAKTARSQVDDIIEEEAPDYIKCLGPDAVESHKERQLVYWTYQRIKATGESWNATVRHYGIEEWVGLKDRDFTLAPDNRVSFISASNGAANGP